MLVVVLVGHIGERSKVHQILGPAEIKNQAPVRGISGLLEHQEELEEAALAGTIGAEKPRNLAEAEVRLLPCLEIIEL